jgi:hypothetical protein
VERVDPGSRVVLTVPAELTKGTRSALARYRREGWTVQEPTLASDSGSVPSPEARDKRQSRLGGVGFVASMLTPDAGLTLHGHGGTPEEAALDILAQAARYRV